MTSSERPGCPLTGQAQASMVRSSSGHRVCSLRSGAPWRRAGEACQGDFRSREPHLVGRASSEPQEASEPQTSHQAIMSTVYLLTAFISVRKPISLPKYLKDARKQLSFSLVMGYRA